MSILGSLALSFLLSISMLFGSVAVSIDGILLEAEMNCAMKCPGRRIHFEVGPHLVLLPDSLVDISGTFPSLFWICANPEWKMFIGKHVKVEGTTDHFLGQENVLTVHSISEWTKGPLPDDTIPELDEATILALEEQIPLMAEVALQRAAWRALLSGFTVLQRKKDMLVEVHPDGTEVFIKNLSDRNCPPPARHHHVTGAETTNPCTQ